MATFITLANFTDQGIQNVKDTTKRAEAFKAAAQKSGATVKELYYTMGQYDLVTIVEAADEQAATAALLSAGKLGNIRSQTLRAFSIAEMDKILSKVS
jgi:uncharacterized protein with GYD domain